MEADISNSPLPWSTRACFVYGNCALRRDDDGDCGAGELQLLNKTGERRVLIQYDLHRGNDDRAAKGSFSGASSPFF